MRSEPFALHEALERDTVAASPAIAGDDGWTVGKRRFHSRLLLGTGKYRDFDETRRAVDASGAEIVTVAIRRTNIGQDANAPSLLDALPPSRYTLLPNTAGCYTADDAVRTLRLARELLSTRRSRPHAGQARGPRRSAHAVSRTCPRR